MEEHPAVDVMCTRCSLSMCLKSEHLCTDMRITHVPPSRSVPPIFHAPPPPPSRSPQIAWGTGQLQRVLFVKEAEEELLSPCGEEGAVSLK